MKKIRLLLALVLTLSIVLSCFGCTKKATVRNVTNEEFELFCDELFKEFLEDNSFNAHFTVTDAGKYGVNYEDEDYIMGTFDSSDIEETERETDDVLAKLREFDDKSLSDSQKIVRDTLIYYFEIQDAFDGTTYLQSVIGPSNGIFSNMSVNFIEFGFYDEEDVENYFLFMKSLPDYMDDLYDFMYDQAEMGYFPMDEIVDQNIEVCKKYLNTENEPLIITFEDKINKLDLPDDRKQEYIEKNAKYVEEYYIPIYEKGIEVLEELKGSGKIEGGLGNYGELGKKLYDAIIMDKTSTKMTPQQVIDYLDEKIEKCLMDMYKVMTFNPDDVDEFYEYEPSYTEPVSVIEDVLERMDEYPKPVVTKYNVEYQNPVCEIDGTLAYYLTARIDDINVNNIKVNGSAVREDPLEMYTTMAHEGYPGHLYQYTSFFANEEVHNVRKILDFIGVTEGWAQYASFSSLDYLCDIDDVSEGAVKLICYNDRYNYLLSARVDLGVNYECWTIDDTYDYILECGIDSYETAESLYFSVVGDPGLIIPYAVGCEQMYDLLDKAETLKGEECQSEFNEFIIENGILPFSIYEDLLEKSFGETK